MKNNCQYCYGGELLSYTKKNGEIESISLEYDEILGQMVKRTDVNNDKRWVTIRDMIDSCPVCGRKF